MKLYSSRNAKFLRDDVGNCCLGIILLFVLYAIANLLSAHFSGDDGDWFFYFMGIIMLFIIIIPFVAFYSEKKITPEERAFYEAKEKKDREIHYADEKKLEIQKVQQEELKNERILKKSADLIDKFMVICERKVSIIDDYGDENWAALQKEIDLCLKKLAEREGITGNKYKDFKNYYWREANFLLGRDYNWWVEILTTEFRNYHEKQKKKPAKFVVSKILLGTEFEVWISKLLKENGFTDVCGTPATGDQGADLIAKKGGKTIIIQVKGYSSPVGNKAVQEVISAVQFYSGDEGWVITNSTFTKSAKALAQRANIKLIDKEMLKDFENV